MVFIGCLSFPTWPFHSKTDSHFSISIKSFIENMSVYLRKDTVWDGLLLLFYQYHHLASGSKKHKCFSTISESISQIAGNRECVCVNFPFSFASSGNPHYDTLSINCKLDQANSIKVLKMSPEYRFSCPEEVVS